ncbi:hypothetical protein OL548_25990 [Lysinibacillus sp. MHQ-1]|nr:hypothetical protein OL548_25990 [Lysinibacillus sp. MHQ-1]
MLNFLNRHEGSPYLALRLIEEAIKLDGMNPRWHYIQGNIFFTACSYYKKI